MSRILSKQRNRDDYGRHDWLAYLAYLEAHRNLVPADLYSVISSNWYYFLENPRSPHDKSMEGASIIQGNESMRVNIMIVISDEEMEMTYLYGAVQSYKMSGPGDVPYSHGGWRYDEFEIYEDRSLIHSIEWGNGSIWRIHASSLEIEFTPIEHQV